MRNDIDGSTDVLSIRRAGAGDRDAVHRLLTDLRLPLDGVPDDLRDFRVATDRDVVVAVAGLEIAGSGSEDRNALLRSVAVHPEYRDRGIARRIVDALLDDAAELGIPTVYLLTTTAADYFERRGFERIQRSSVPAALTATAEFQGACPASATVMKLDLRTAAK